MSKAEFLQCLEKRLEILNQKERADILSEYEQHIEMRMKGGLTEEEAIKDFGDIDELVEEILDAYNVNPEYGKKKNILHGKKVEETVTKGASKVGRAFRRVWEAVWKGISSAGRKIRSWCGAFLTWCRSILHFPEKRKKEDTMDKDWDMMTETGTDRAESCRRKRRESGNWMSAAGRTCGWIWHAALWCALLFLKCLVIFFVWPVLIAELAAVVGLGILIVLLFMGYPVIGLVIITIGCLMSGAVVLWLVKEILFLKIKGSREEVNIQEITETKEESEVCEA
ncbi:DUF1700 domain-containing protein [Clostridium sp. AM58-1XD]|uniref:DUF1700 domain-containing protein n=1 Tax=Clostridium sp. AM58-1XD TaxID=2292307 RepID=UPI000E4FA823|nr:DUF1700 domain-containing protein [Clostridium sp. AM58-1XD]RGZ00891.1 DUF1700 domain-containing protein [Clostridium sp. AM58-1XD]